MPSNYPPGVGFNDLPGNSDEAGEWQSWTDKIDAEDIADSIIATFTDRVCMCHAVTELQVSGIKPRLIDWLNSLDRITLGCIGYSVDANGSPPYH